jgi:hypothetical protein
MKPTWVFLDPKVEADFAIIGKDVPAFLDLVSRDRADKKWIVAIRRSEAPAGYFIFDRTTKKRHWLFDEQPALAQSYRAQKKPVVIKARDGFELVSYLTTPAGVEAKNLPLVLLIHGGPWYRDHDNYDPEVQFLANRGYAVLQVNYRGSTGFGLKFLNAGTNEWGRGTQQDLFDAVQWAVVRESRTRSGSQRWAGREVVLQPSSRWRCGPIYSLAEWMGLVRRSGHAFPFLSELLVQRHDALAPARGRFRS